MKLKHPFWIGVLLGLVAVIVNREGLLSGLKGTDPEERDA